MALGLIETRNAITQISLPALHQRSKVETLFTKMISDQEEKNGLLATKNAQLQQRKIAMKTPADQIPIELLEHEILQIKEAIEAARTQELSLTQMIAQKQQDYTRKLSQTEKLQAMGRYFQHEGI